MLLLFKNKRDKENLKNYKLFTTININYKIFTKILMQQLVRALSIAIKQH